MDTRRAWLVASIAIVLGLSVVPAVAKESLTWAGGVAGGGWDAISTGMAALIREKTGLNVRAIPGGGTQNPVLLARGDAGVAMGMPLLLSAALRGEDPYAGRKMEGLQGLAGNVSLGGTYLAWLIGWFGDPSRFGGYDVSANRELLRAVISAYNYGHGAVTISDGKAVVPNPSYVNNVLALMNSCPCDRY